MNYSKNVFKLIYLKYTYESSIADLLSTLFGYMLRNVVLAVHDHREGFRVVGFLEGTLPAH